MATRVYVGRLPYRATERDIERFFRNYGRLSEVILKNGFGFVDFEELRDAEDAAHDLNGKELMGVSLIVELARGTPRGRDRYGWHPPPGGAPRRSPARHSSSHKSRDRESPARRFRVNVENLSSRVTKEDLKDLFRKCGDILYVEANGRHKNEGYVEFESRKDAEYAVEKFNGHELEGRKIRVVEDKPKRRSRSGSGDKKSRRHSRSRSPAVRSPRNSKGVDDDEDNKSTNGVNNNKEHSRSASVGSHGRYSDADKEGSKERDD